jgi:hypothetical protein
VDARIFDVERLRLYLARDVLADGGLRNTETFCDFVLRKATFGEFGGKKSTEGREERLDYYLAREFHSRISGA